MKITSGKKNTMLINFVTALFMMSMSLILMSFCGTENESNRVLTIVTGIFFLVRFHRNDNSIYFYEYNAQEKR